MIPPERQFVEVHGVSIGTVKKALLNLVNEGYLYRVQGKGTFVAGTTLRRESLRYYRFLENFSDREKRLSVKLIGINKIAGSEPVNSYLKIKKNKDLLEIKRVFSSEETPFVYTVSFLPESLFRGIDELPSSLFENQTLYATIEEYYGLPTIQNRELIGAMFPDIEAAKFLGVQISQPVLFIEMLAFTYKERPYEYRRAYCLAERLKIFREY